MTVSELRFFAQLPNCAAPHRFQRRNRLLPMPAVIGDPEDLGYHWSRAFGFLVTTELILG